MKIGVNIVLITAWFLLIFFGLAALVATASRQYFFIPSLLALSCLGLFILLYFGHVEMNDETVRQKTLLGNYEIRWDEIQAIETRSSQSTFVLIGKNKTLTIIGPSLWPAHEIEQIGDFISMKMEVRQISFQEGKRSFRFPRNTKIIK